MSNVTKTQMEDVFYRTMLLSDKMEELEGIISGRGTSLGITDGDGITVPKKLKALIQSLIESLKHYLALGGRELKEWEEEMYSCFLYCAMQQKRWKENRRNPSFGYFECTGKFGDIIEIAAQVGTDGGISSYRDFLKQFYSYYRYSTREKFQSYFCVFDNSEYEHKMSEFCSQVLSNLRYLLRYNDRSFIIDLPRETRMELCREYALEHSISDRNNEPFLKLADVGPSEFFYDEWLKDWGSDEPWAVEEDNIEKHDLYMYIDMQTLEEYGVTVDLFEEERKKKKIFEALRTLDEISSYKNNELLSGFSFEEIEKFRKEMEQEANLEINQYFRNKFVMDAPTLREKFLRFLELYYDNDHSRFYGDVVNMVEAYLIEHGLSPFGFGDDYGLIMYQLEKAQNRVVSEIERVSGKWQ